MSENRGGVGEGERSSAENGVGASGISAAHLASIARVLTSSSNGSRWERLSPAAIAHTFGVCMLELDAMARGGKNGKASEVQSTLPRFVDVKLTVDQRKQFLTDDTPAENLVKLLAALCDDGYRVGCQWNGEQNSYTVSLTCRAAKSPNSGLCMTSFAGDLLTAVRLAIFKHEVVTGGEWLGEGGSVEADFG